MAHVSILGTGNMAQAISSVVTKGGSTVELLGRANADTPISGGIVVRALPYSAIESVLEARGAQLPDSKVLKAFNTTFAATLTSGTVGDAPTTVLVAGDDKDAKGALLDVVTSGGLQGIDAGSMKRARELEALGFLQLTLAGAAASCGA